MKELFLNHELSLLFKEKGFGESCFGWYNGEDFHHMILSPLRENEWPSHKPDFCAAPLYQQAIDWFREKHGIDVRVFRADNEGNYYPNILTSSQGLDWENIWRGEYYKALDKAIEEALKLIP